MAAEFNFDDLMQVTVVKKILGKGFVDMLVSDMEILMMKILNMEILVQLQMDKNQLTKQLYCVRI